MLLGFLRRLIIEDFKKEDRDAFGKLAAIFNPALENISTALNKNISFYDNIYCQVKDITVTVDSTGAPRSATSYRTELKTPVKGLWVIKADNQTNVNTYPTSQPFISYSEQAGQVLINNITGLQANNKYVLRLIAIG